MRSAIFAAILGAVPGAFVMGASPARGEDPPEEVRIPTVFVEADAFAPDPDNPTERLATPAERDLEVVPKAPAGLTRAPDGTVAFAAPRVGARTLFVGFIPGGGMAGTIVADLNGDGDLTPLVERFPVEGRPVRRRNAPNGVAYEVDGLAVDGVAVAVTFERAEPTLEAVVAASGQRAPVTVAFSPPRGTKAIGDGARYLTLPAAVAGAERLVALRRTGEELTVVVDRDGDKKLDADGESVTAVAARSQPGTRAWLVADLALGESPVQLAVRESPGPITASVEGTGARKGRGQVNGEAWAIHLVDGDFDGVYGSEADRWWFGPVERLSRVSALDEQRMVEATAPFFAEGGWRLVGVEKDGTAVVRKDPSASAQAYFHDRSKRVAARWQPRFEAEAATFLPAQGIDPGRPSATKPVEWMHDVDIEAALARAKRENKPVLVDFEADWCIWCYRLDHFVYGDAEVANLLRRFVPVKISHDFHFSGDFERLGGKGLPSIFFLAPNGDPLSFESPDPSVEGTVSMLDSFQPPQRMTEWLRAALEASKTAPR